MPHDRQADAIRTATSLVPPLTLCEVSSSVDGEPGVRLTLDAQHYKHLLIVSLQKAP